MGVIARQWWQLGVLSVFGVGVQALSAEEGLAPDVRAWAYTLSFALGPLLLICRQDLVVSLRAADDVQVVADAGDGRSAVEAARRARPDVALVDIRMPGMDGLTAGPGPPRAHPTTVGDRR